MCLWSLEYQVHNTNCSSPPTVWQDHLWTDIPDCTSIIKVDRMILGKIIAITETLTVNARLSSTTISNFGSTYGISTCFKTALLENVPMFQFWRLFSLVKRWQNSVKVLQWTCGEGVLIGSRTLAHSGLGSGFGVSLLFFFLACSTWDKSHTKLFSL